MTFPAKRVLIVVSPRAFKTAEAKQKLIDELESLGVQAVVFLNYRDEESIRIFDLDKLESGQVASVSEALDFTE